MQVHEERFAATLGSPIAGLQLRAIKVLSPLLLDERPERALPVLQRLVAMFALHKDAGCR